MNVPAASGQPHVRRNEWGVLSPPALGGWEPRLTVSMVVPAYNAGRLLPTVLAGLAAQTYPAHLMEVLVVNDGPGELTLPEVRPENTRIIDVVEGWGRANACHTGALAADGEVLHWYDADMLAERHEVEAQLRWHHLIDYAVVLGHKWFVEPGPVLTMTPDQVRDTVAADGLARLFAAQEKVPHGWVEDIYERTDDLRLAGAYAMRTHTGATASVPRALYLASGGMDTTLRLGEDTNLGARLHRVGACFIPDDDARSWHLGFTHVMGRQHEINGYNDPYLADDAPEFRTRRYAGRSYALPYLEVDLDVGDGSNHAQILGFVDSVLASTVHDLRVRLRGPWAALTGERTRVLDDGRTGLRILEATYRSDPRVLLGDEPAPEAAFVLHADSPAWAPSRAALERLLLHMEYTHDGERVLTDGTGPWARLRRGAAWARARHLLGADAPTGSVDLLATDLWGSDDVPAATVGFVPVGETVRARYARVGGPALESEPAWRQVDRALRRSAQVAGTIDVDDDGSSGGALPPPLADFLDTDGAVLLAEDTPAGDYARLAVRIGDLAELRATTWPAGIRAKNLGLWIDDQGFALTLVPPPGWPALRALRSRMRPTGTWTTLRMGRFLGIDSLLGELGRQALPGRPAGEHGLRVRPAAGYDPDADVPADVLIDLDGSLDASDSTGLVSDITGRAPLVVRDPDGVLALGPIDERVINPCGFEVWVDGPVLDVVGIDLSRGATAPLVASLRTAAGVHLSNWDDVPTTALSALAALAMAGVPLTASTVPDRVAAALGDAVGAAISAPVDLADTLAREEHSVALRRAALDTFSRPAWRARLAERAGVAMTGQPSVSVLLASKRPEQIDFALRQVARQRGVRRLELVLAPHGFDVDAARVRDAVGPEVAVQVLPHPAEALFGDVLQAAARAASGDVVLKMDDDDWYAPDVIADLLRARLYSGADLVGMPLEFHYVAPVDRTVRKGHPSEFFARFVAGGTLMIGRDHLLDLGGFRPVRKFVDAQLLDSVLAAGGSIYRTHGLGYVLRRTAGGHTWDIELDELLDPDRMVASWSGFHPSRLLEADPADLPTPPAEQM